MRRAITWILAVLVVALVAGTVVLYRNNQQRQAELASTQQQQQDLQARYDRTIGAIAEIQDSLDAIEASERRVNVVSRELAAERRLRGPQSRDVLESIAALRTSINRNKQRITQLEANLRRSGTRVAGLQRLVAQLRKNVTEREQMVAVLTAQTDSLRTQVVGLATAVAEREDTLRIRDLTLEERRRDLATVFYVVGSKRELTEQGVITAKGGLLGIGKTIIPTGRTDSPSFNAVDTDRQTVIPTDARKAKVLTAQPPGSYQLVEVDGRVELHILDPTAFRRVRQLVIMTQA